MDLRVEAADSEAFARLSGDFNPLHVDAQAARRLQFGGTVCHGVHLVLATLDQALQTGLLQVDRVMAVQAVFHSAVLTGSPLKLSAYLADTQSLRLSGSTGGKALFTVKFQQQARAAGPVADPCDAAPEQPGVARAADFPVAPPWPGGQVPVSLNSALARRLFPALSAESQGRRLIAELAATTRIVGMECPGLHSIYAELRLERRAEAMDLAQGVMRFQVQRADPRFRSVRMDVSGPVWQGVLDAFFRALPVAQPALVDLASQVPAGRFAGQRALVVGGSRGLGELASKLLLAGGAEVTLTYAGGEQDARRICDEAERAGCLAQACRLDLLSTLPEDLAHDIAAAGFTHLYHFATPLIAKGGAGGWNPALFDRFSRFYVHGLADLVRATLAGRQQAPNAAPLTVLYPSTEFLDVPARGFAEYCAAKAAGEVLAEHLALTHRLRLHRPRLPRLQTDQNSSFLGVEGAAPLPVMLALLLDMHPGAADARPLAGATA